MSDFLKRTFDILFAILFLTLLSPVFLITAFIIVLCSPGDPIYRSKRVGRNGKIFTCYKFRSMREGSGKVRLTTLRNDERIFPFGRFIRKTKIDEMPQIFNVLLGDMSVVGPRPEDVDNACRIFAGKYVHILDIKPGLTSPASLYDYIKGEKYETVEDYEKEFLPQKLELELYYVEHRNIFYDIQICFRTAVTILLVVVGKERIKPPPELERSKFGQLYGDSHDK